MYLIPFIHHYSFPINYLYVTDSHFDTSTLMLTIIQAADAVLFIHSSLKAY